MPSSAEYFNAITFTKHRLGDDSLALRWLRVGAAMEAGTIRLFPPVEKPGLWLARNDAMNRSHYLSDPLTAAERAMGVGM